MTAFLLQWAVRGGVGVHTDTPTQAALEAQGWTVCGADPRYAGTVLMRRDVDEDEEA